MFSGHNLFVEILLLVNLLQLHCLKLQMSFLYEHDRLVKASKLTENLKRKLPDKSGTGACKSSEPKRKKRKKVSLRKSVRLNSTGPSTGPTTSGSSSTLTENNTEILEAAESLASNDTAANNDLGALEVAESVDAKDPATNDPNSAQIDALMDTEVTGPNSGFEAAEYVAANDNAANDLGAFEVVETVDINDSAANNPSSAEKDNSLVTEVSTEPLASTSGASGSTAENSKVDKSDDEMIDIETVTEQVVTNKTAESDNFAERYERMLLSDALGKKQKDDCDVSLQKVSKQKLYSIELI